MADDPIDTRKDYHKEPAPWTKLFAAFKIALDPKKLLLAGCGLLVMSLGWYLLAALFFSANSTRPEWKDFEEPGATQEAKRKAWQEFKLARHRWYLLYEMAGAPQIVQKEKEVDGKKEKVDARVEYI